MHVRGPTRGIHPGSECIDQMFILRRIPEQRYKFQRPITEFESTERARTVKDNVPSKPICLIKSRYSQRFRIMVYFVTRVGSFQSFVSAERDV